MIIAQLLQDRLHQALTGIVADPAPFAAQVKASQDPKHGDYQANCAMALAKSLGKPPREIAQAIVANLKIDDFAEPPQVAGPGFINIRLKSDWLAQQVQALARDARLGVALVAKAKTFVIDYSSPNVAKPMHVGHLRSTILGDALTRLLRFLGHHVITDNHLGDWGTQFGMLLHGYKHYRNDAAMQSDPVGELGRLYKLVRDLTRAADDEDEDPSEPNEAKYTAEEEQNAQAALAACREETAKLHAGDPENVTLWKSFMPACLEVLAAMYKRLGILQFDHTLGESYYNPLLADVVRDLQAKGIAEESRGAIVVKFGEDEPPAIVRKSDGAFTYTTTDLATVRHRLESFHPDVILYVVDFRQAFHFKCLFTIVQRWGCENVLLEHVSFGSVCGVDGKPLKTREGVAASLDALLDEAVARAKQVTLENQDSDGGQETILVGRALDQIAEVVGIGAVKYADLSQNRESNYVFSPEKMTALTGNTATYMQYAYARNRSIFRKGRVDPRRFTADPPLPTLGHADERALALKLLRFEEALTAAAADYRPNLITAYLWDLAKTYSGFFQNCPVLKAETPELRDGRLLLCDATARVIQLGLELLGIRTLERM